MQNAYSENDSDPGVEVDLVNKRSCSVTMSLCETMKANSFPPQRFPFHLELQDSSVVVRQRRVEYIWLHHKVLHRTI